LKNPVSIADRFVLGTVQLGMNYGIANTSGQPDEQAAVAVVRAAWTCGVRCFDTAQAYGKSEEVLGHAFSILGVSRKARVVSKLNPALDPSDRDGLLLSIENSRAALGVPELHCMMLHRAEWLDRWDEGLGQALCAARDRGLVRHLGVSVYSVEEAERALECDEIDSLQVPCNPWDQRMRTSGLIRRAREQDRTCYVRSVYLQGLLLMDPESVARKMPRAEGASRRWHQLVAEQGSTPAEMCVRFGNSLACPLVLGAESEEQVRNNAGLIASPPLDEQTCDAMLTVMAPYLDDRTRNPSLWSQP
jgi:aryl-alcohol dehydrogenase-like predicted oxidoreductase